MNQINLPEAAYGKNADKVPTQNVSRSYYWMENAKGRKVPVAPFNVADALSRGYIHTDRELHRDNPADRVQPSSASQDPMARLADTLEKVVEEKVEKPKRKRRAKAKTEEVEEKAGEVVAEEAQPE